MAIPRYLRATVYLGGLLLSGAVWSAGASAGYERLQVPAKEGAPLIDVVLWFPTDAPAAPSDFGPFTMNVARGGNVRGEKLPLVLVSHGNGGSAMSHHDTAVALAEAGFVVAALEHPGDNYKDQSRAAAILERPAHVSRTIDHLLGQWRGRTLIDPSRIGAFGFSSGGFTVLALGGGQAELARVGPHCEKHPRDYACEVVRRQSEVAKAAVLASERPVRDARVKAIVSAAPALGFTFRQESLAAMTVPVQLWRAEADEVLPHPWYAEAVRAGLPKPVEYHEVGNAGHYEFLAPCSLSFSRMAPPLCRSRKGFSREAFHRDFNERVVGFFQRTLAK